MINSRIIPGVVTGYLIKYGQPSHGSTTDKAQRLEAYFLIQSARNSIKLSHCDLCAAASDSSLPECAFCGDAAPVEGAEPAPEEGNAITVQPVSGLSTALDQVLEELNKCASIHWANLYRTGILLRHIRDEELWRQRINENGVPKYKGYLDFVAAEVGIKAAYATRLIRVVDNFSAEDVSRWGIQRLFIAARLPEDKRKGFIRQTAHLPTRDLPAAANETGADSFPRMTGKEIITKVPIGRVLARMYVKPNRNSRVGVPEEEALSLEQRPWTQIKLPGDVWMRIDIKRALDGTGVLVAGVSFRKGKPLDGEGRAHEEKP